MILTLTAIGGLFGMFVAYLAGKEEGKNQGRKEGINYAMELSSRKRLNP